VSWKFNVEAGGFVHFMDFVDFDIKAFGFRSFCGFRVFRFLGKPLCRFLYISVCFGCFSFIFSTFVAT